MRVPEGVSPMRPEPGAIREEGIKVGRIVRSRSEFRV